MVMNQMNAYRWACLVLLAWAPSAFSHNVTISNAFDGTESTMAASPASCDGTAKRFRQAGTFQVSVSGSYRVADAGNNFPYFGLDADIADVVVILYAGSFSSASPATNRVASIDEGEQVALSAGTSYIVVVQHWCNEILGPYAAVIEGPGVISGAGFNSLDYTYGEFLGGAPTADFPGIGVVRYTEMGPITVPRSGNYFFGDIGSLLGIGSLRLYVYAGDFNPADPVANLVTASAVGPTSIIALESGVNYIFVAADLFNEVNLYQFVLFPPGSFVFNPGLNGAWVATGVEAQGIFLEVFPSVGILFFAHFTFNHLLAVSLDQGAQTTMQADEGVTKVQNDVGSADQRWLTAFGDYPSTGNFMTLTYENSTGGAFNAELPVATTDSNYGTGWIEAFSCKRMLINWTLSGGTVDTREYHRLLNDGVPYCHSFIKAAPISPPL